VKRHEIVDQVNSVLKEGFEVDAAALKADAHLYYDLGIDSLDAIDMLVYIEEKLGRTVDATLFKGARRLEDIYDVVDRIVSGDAAAPTGLTEPKPATT
jgi:acyl carrier protein